jgi:hypothetical protein
VTPGRPERPAPLVLVPAPAEPREPFGSYAAVAETARQLLSAEMTGRLARAGAAVQPLPPPTGDAAEPAFHWGRWFAAAAGAALAAARDADRAVDAIGYVGAGALALAPDDALDELLAPIPGEVVANNRFSTDAFVVAAALPEGVPAPDGTTRRGPDLGRALDRLDACPTDNTATRCLESAGFRSRDLSGRPWTRFDVDTPLDAALLRLAGTLPDVGWRPSTSLRSFLEMARLPGDRDLSVPSLTAIGAVMRDRTAQLVVAGRVPSAVLATLEVDTACRVRAFVEERGMRAARDHRPRSLLARWIEERGPAGLVAELAALGDAVILDTRVLMAALAGSADAMAWPAPEERFAADFGDPGPIRTAWLAELVTATREASVPFLLGGHALISDGLRLLVAAAWAGR